MAVLISTVVSPGVRPGRRAEVRQVQAADANPLTRAEKEAVVAANQGLVGLVARKYRNLGLDLEDLMSLGNIGLLHAAESFEPARGCRFSTHAMCLVRRYIYRGIQDLGRTIRVPAQSDVALAAFQRMRRLLPDGATEEDIFKAMDLPPGRRRPIRDAMRAKVQGDNSPLADLTVEPEHPLAGLIADEEAEQLAHAIRLLPPHLAEVITRRFGLGGSDPLNITETVRELGISERTVRRRESEALDLLRRLLVRAGSDDAD